MNTPGNSHNHTVERRKHRRQAYFHGKYAKENVTFILIIAIFVYYLLSQ